MQKNLYKDTHKNLKLFDQQHIKLLKNKSDSYLSIYKFFEKRAEANNGNLIINTNEELSNTELENLSLLLFKTHFDIIEKACKTNDIVLIADIMSLIEYTIVNTEWEMSKILEHNVNAENQESLLKLSQISNLIDKNLVPLYAKSLINSFNITANEHLSVEAIDFSSGFFEILNREPNLFMNLKCYVKCTCKQKRENKF